MSFPPARLPFADGVIGVGSAVAIVPWLRGCEYVCADFVLRKVFFPFSSFLRCNEVIIVVVRGKAKMAPTQTESRLHTYRLQIAGR